MAKKAAARRQYPDADKVDELDEPRETEEVSSENWKMPVPLRGQPIVFYPRSTLSITNSQLAFVSSVHTRSIEIVSGSQGFGDVYHRDDPRLVDNPDLRLEIHGVWEFLEKESSIEVKIAELEERVAKLEG